jgi:hypothetical protein
VLARKKSKLRVKASGAARCWLATAMVFQPEAREVSLWEITVAVRGDATWAATALSDHTGTVRDCRWRLLNQHRWKDNCSLLQPFEFPLALFIGWVHFSHELTLCSDTRITTVVYAPRSGGPY